MVARGAGAAGPVLLACRQWDPLGLARRLPSPGVGAWRCAPLLPWRVQCPVCVCAAIAAGSGGSGRYLVLCLSLFPLPAPRVRRCVWRAVQSGCPLPSLAGTPFHVVCAFRALGPVALLVVPACPFRVCALALSRCPLPPPWVVWRAHLAWSRHWALVGPFHVVRAPPRVLFRSLAPTGVLGGGRSGPGSPLLGLGLWGWRQGVPGGGAFYRCEGRLGSCAPPPPTARALGGLPGPAIHVLWARACGCGGPALSPRPARPVGAARRGAGPWRSCAGKRAGGGGGGVRRTPRLCGRGGAVERGSLCLIPSLCLPWAGNKAGVTGVVLSRGGVAPHTVRAHQASLGTVRRRGLACSARPPWGPAAWAGGRVALRLLSRAGGGHPPCLGGWGLGPQQPAGRWGGGGGGRRAAASLLPFWAADCGTQSLPPLCRRRAPFRRVHAVGAEVPPRGGGGEGRSADRSPGGPCRPEPPLCPP